MLMLENYGSVPWCTYQEKDSDHSTYSTIARLLVPGIGILVSTEYSSTFNSRHTVLYHTWYGTMYDSLSYLVRIVVTYSRYFNIFDL